MVFQCMLNQLGHTDRISISVTVLYHACHSVSVTIKLYHKYVHTVVAIPHYVQSESGL